MCFFSPIRNDPKKKKRKHINNFLAPTQSRDNPANLFMFMCFFFPWTLAHKTLSAGHWSSRSGIRTKRCMVPSIAHKSLTPGHPIGRLPSHRGVTGQKDSCLCAFFPLIQDFRALLAREFGAWKPLFHANFVLQKRDSQTMASIVRKANRCPNRKHSTFKARDKGFSLPKEFRKKIAIIVNGQRARAPFRVQAQIAAIVWRRLNKRNPWPKTSTLQPWIAIVFLTVALCNASAHITPPFWTFRLEQLRLLQWAQTQAKRKRKHASETRHLMPLNNQTTSYPILAADSCQSCRMTLN